MHRNELVLSGLIGTQDALRFTPGGIPSFSFQLKHQSTQPEAEHSVQVAFDLWVLALGPVAQQLAQLESGSCITLKGYLIRKHRSSPQLVLRAIQFKMFDGE